MTLPTVLLAMTEKEKTFFVGIALIVFGIGTVLFGGTTETGSSTEIFGFRFGHRESRPMGKGESIFWGLASIAAGVVLIHWNS